MRKFDIFDTVEMNKRAEEARRFYSCLFPPKSKIPNIYYDKEITPGVGYD